MAAEDLLVFPSHVKITSIKDLNEEMRRKINWQEGDVVITKINSRIPSKVISSDVLLFLKEFTKPIRFTDAIIHFSKVQHLDPYELLEQLFPLIAQLKEEGLIAVAGTHEEKEIEATYRAGDFIDKYKIVEVVQVLNDSEVYKVEKEGRVYALKIAGEAGSTDLLRQLKNEASILEHLHTPHTPKLMDANYVSERMYLVIEWIEGVSILKYLRQLPTEPERELQHKVKVCCHLLKAFQKIHGSGILHCDIHPKNILVTTAGEIKIIDFGLAGRLSEESDFLNCGGVPYFFEPEYALSLVHKAPPPNATLLGEQYSIATLIYLCLTGNYYLDFTLEREQALIQICKEAPLPFSYWKTPPRPELEATLNKALQKNPKDRFPSLSSFENDLTKVKRALDKELSSKTPHPVKSPDKAYDKKRSMTFFENTIKKYDFSTELLFKGLSAAPTCSISFGDAGISYFFYRSAVILDNAAFLSIADIWVNNAKRKLGNPDAFYSDYLKISKENIDPVSLYHHAGGLYCVEVLICNAMGDAVAAQRAIDNFITSCSHFSKQLDLTTGKTSILLGGAIIIEAVQHNSYIDTKRLIEFCNKVYNEIISILYEEGSVFESKKIYYLGIAHGWAGILYGILRWTSVTKAILDGIIKSRLDELLFIAERPASHEASWTRSLSDKAIWTGWCHGSAGYTYLWTLAHRVFKDSTYLELAQSAARYTLNNIERNSINLCCGTSGQVYALLHLYKYSHNPFWLKEALHLANITFNAIGTHVLVPHSLLKGDLGLALLGIELTKPFQACMPLFESEGISPDTLYDNRRPAT